MNKKKTQLKYEYLFLSIFLNVKLKISKSVLPILLILFFFSVLQAETRFLIYSPPKNGTHLIAKAVQLISGREAMYRLGNFKNTQETIDTIINDDSRGYFTIAHNLNEQTLEYLVKKRNYIIIFLIRDPRDQLISVKNWLREGQWPWIKCGKIANDELLIEELITGKQTAWRCVDSCFLKYEAALKSIPKNKVHISYFENLVGSQGGGSLERQIFEISQLAKFININLEKKKIEGIANQLFGESGTFRSGQIGSWQTQFNQAHKDQFKKLYNPLLIRLGYEKDQSW